VLAKKSRDSGSGSFNSDNGDKGPSDPSKEDTKDLTSDDSKVEPGIPGHDGVPAKDSDDDNTVRIPEQGWVDGKWTGGTDEMFDKGPNGDGKIPQGCTPGGCTSQPIQSPPPASAQSQ
jgi:hypothetical protein